jgi:ABC-type antimicrobial peptide transport system permease subunit
MSYMMVRRTGEIGLRMALGALPRQVFGLVLRESAVLVTAGAGLGIAAALGASRFLESLLFGLSPSDPLTYGAIALLLVALGLPASALPARRASRVNPLDALRAD